MQTEPTPSRRAARLAWALCALSVAFGAATIALALLNGTSPRDFVVHYAALGPFVGLTPGDAVAAAHAAAAGGGLAGQRRQPPCPSGRTCGASTSAVPL
jgi:hypothetical protein